MRSVTTIKHTLTTLFKSLFLLVLVGGFFASSALAESQINPARAKFNYQLFCQGCHVGDGRGGKDVPNFIGFVGNFLKTDKGREYLLRVPGSANSAVNDEKLAELMNWIILEFGEQSVPKDFRYYTAEEVGRIRKSPLMEVVEYRKAIIQDLKDKYLVTPKYKSDENLK
jgi:hypothetical protein|tara:strand:- start:12061 stop:12567 length:507 start_codon:yes stop_codon:yes gene_type:complete